MNQFRELKRLKSICTSPIKIIGKVCSLREAIMSQRTVGMALCSIMAWITMASVLFNVFADGTLSVKTDPEGIEVWLDDNYIGDSPIADKKLKAGRYSLKLIDPVQHTSTIEQIFIQDNETTAIEKTLKAKFGSLRINSVPEGAKVYISTELGTTPVSNDFMNPGKYRIEVRHPNPKYRSANDDVVVQQGSTVNLSKTLEKEKEKGFGKLDALRLGLGVVTLGGFIWAIVEQGDHKMNEQKAISYAAAPAVADDYQKKADGAGVRRTVGIIIGSTALVGLEIVAFF